MADNSSFEWSASSLKLLYQITASLISATDDGQKFHDFLILLIRHFNAKAGSIQLITDDGLMDLLSSFGFTDEQAHSIQHSPIPGHLFSFETEVIEEIQIHENTLFTDSLPPKQLCIPIRYKIQTLGVINLFVENEILITEELAYLLLAVGAHLGEIIKRSLREQEEKNQLIKNERNIIANELHDSLAQNLASLRFQVRILDQNVQPSGDFKTINTIENIEHSLDEAGTALRELIAHCRAPIEERGLIPAIKRAVENFRKDTGINILLQCKDEELKLPSNIELNVFRIVQEALTNIKKHATAYIVRVLVNHDGNGNVHILVENDGKGFDLRKIHSSDGKHLGLTIMQERARHIGADLKIDSEPDEGTRVELNFQFEEDNVKT